MLKHVFALIAIAAASAAASSTDVKLAQVKSFSDWAVACDNGLGCEATSFYAENLGEAQLYLSLSRAAGPDGAISIAIDGFDSRADHYSLSVDRRLIHTGTMTSGAGMIEIVGADATKVARALVSGSKIKIADGDGNALGQISLAGSAAVLRYIDATQGRAGSASAIAARGRKAAKGKIVALPLIEAQKITPTTVLPDAASLVNLSEISPCAAEREGSVSQDTAFSLGNDASGAPRALVLLFCGTGAYNPSFGIYVGTRSIAGKWDFAPADFDFRDAFTQTGKIPLMGYAEWDAASQRLSGYYKNRGIGDCGRSEQYVWDGQRFRLKLATNLEECRGSMDWLTVWRADVKLKG